MKVRTRIDVDLRAFHTDPHMDEGRHEHVWNVQLEYEGAPFRDGRAFRAALTQWLEPFQGQDLPPEWWSGEALASAVLSTLGTGDPLACIVRRPGFEAEARL